MRFDSVVLPVRPDLCDDECVPLSDEEERVLAEIEAQLASDHVADRMRGRTLENPPSVGVPALLAVACFVVSIVGFTVHVSIGILGFIGFLAALVPLVHAALAPYVDDSDHIRYY
jgi:Protein of unknown function (DUF3040)